jgi:hypothetical protein
MLKAESGQFNEFVGTRVNEVKVNSNTDDKWYWLTGVCNRADLDSRKALKPGDLVAGLEYQEGTERMRRPESEWRCKRSFRQEPAEEMRNDIVAIASAANQKALLLVRIQRGHRWDEKTRI